MAKSHDVRCVVLITWRKSFDEQASYSGADLLLPGGLLLRLDAHKVAVEQLGIVLRYRGPYIHVVVEGTARPYFSLVFLYLSRFV